MIDIHNHILFDIDDGAPDLDTSVDMCRDAFENGYRTIVVTPHFADYNHIDDFVDQRDYKIEKLRGILQIEDIPLKVLSGAELFLSDGILNAGSLDDLAINNSRYMLCEFPLGPFNMKRGLLWIDELIERGYTPILAHPERYFEIHRNLSVIDELLDRDVVFQVNIDSLIGKNGSTAQQLSVDLICRGFAGLIGTDAHDLKYRHTRTKERIRELPYEIDHEIFVKCIKTNPQKIIDDEEI
ncbi:MAG: hypothetical protein IJA43_05010 [Clostridia bacterium]|nr:hypothetical protein [Clostridia bacterium]